MLAFSKLAFVNIMYFIAIIVIIIIIIIIIR